MSRTIRTIYQALAILVGLVLSSSAIAAPRKVLVLPLDGDAEPEIRAKYSASVQRMARTLDGKVTAGDVAFNDTATAIGCNPKVPKCAEDVRATLGVDELVYGTMTKEDGKLVLVVRRVAKGKPRREVSATLEVTDAPERAEPELLPLFRESTATTTTTTTTTPPTPPPIGTGPGTGAGEPTLHEGTGTETGTGTGTGIGIGTGTEEPPKETPPPPAESTPLSRNKVLAYAAIGGGGTLLLISFALWSSASGLEGDIDSHPLATYSDFVAVRDLEDRASTRAWTGNALFLVGLAAGGLGGWMLYRDRKAQHTIVAPAPVPGGAALLLGGVF